MLRWKSSLKPTSGGGGGGTNGLSTGLIRAYLAEDLTDELGNANLTVRGSGISSTTGKNNNCYTYSTSGGHVSDWFPDSNNWTISCWINADAIDSATFDGTIGCHDNNNHRAYFGLGNSNEAVVGVGDSYDTDSAATYSAGTWYNFITIWDGTNAWCFINGVLRIKFAANFSGTSTDALHLGERIYNGGTQYNQYDGKQDETYIWSRALDVGSATSVGDTGGGDIANLQTLFYASFNGVADYRSTVLADNPLFYYRLGETSGTTALDEVTSSSNGTYPTVPLLGQTGAISGDSNKCPLFREANSEYAETVTLSSETSLLPCTIECFIKTDGASDHTGGILMIRGATNASGLNMYGSSTSVKRLGYHWNNGSATWQFSSGPTFADDTWYYVALVIESTKATFYMIDESGTLTTPAVKTTTHAAIDVSSNGWTIGRDYGYANRSFQGYIDEVAIYDQAFSQSKVVAHAAAAGFALTYTTRIEEGFEGSGTPSGWSTYVGSGGTIDFDNTSYVKEGSQNLRVTSNNYTNTYYNLGTQYDHVILTLARRATSLSNRQDVFLYNSGGNRGSNTGAMQFGAVSGSNQGIRHDSNNLRITMSGSINTNHYIRIEIDVPNDIVKIARSNDGTSFPTSGTNYNESSGNINSAFGGVQYIALGASNKNATQYYDDLKLVSVS